ncbi:MAG: DAK2 domain-containing protein, partial [Spirochaetota bacterium]
METTDTVNGEDLKGMFTAATDWLEQNAPYINALNVFPVPDGDTGFNMLLSMRSALKEACNVSGESASRVAEAFAQGALLGARGNSGVILSQFWQGLARGFKGKKFATVLDLAKGLRRSSVLVFQAVSKPVEGTILTVVKDIASTAGKLSRVTGDIISFMEKVVTT